MRVFLFGFLLEVVFLKFGNVNCYCDFSDFIFYNFIFVNMVVVSVYYEVVRIVELVRRGEFFLFEVGIGSLIKWVVIVLKEV